MQLDILGGGPAGLALAYHAQKKGLAFRLYEARDKLGGNCITFTSNGFRFDSGAHRLHDKIPSVTQTFRDILGKDMHKVEAPSQIVWEGKFIDFPLTPFDLVKKLGVSRLSRAAFDFLKARIKRTTPKNHFEYFARKTYGDFLAENFLLNYSSKLWGLPTNQLSPSISGKRLKGLNLKTFLVEALFGKLIKTQHIDGSFYYPKYGIGQLFDKLQTRLNPQAIHLNTRITRIFHKDNRITEIEYNGTHRQAVNHLVSTLPLGLMLQLLSPSPSPALFTLAKQLVFRNIVLVAIFLSVPSISPNASLYFPNKNYPFTRIVEARNRSPFMAPEGHSSLIVEVPCQFEDAQWKASPKEIGQQIIGHLADIGLIQPSDVVGMRHIKMPFAYPILAAGYEKIREDILHYLTRFNNLKMAGRNAEFQYTHIHDMFFMGENVIQQYIS